MRCKEIQIQMASEIPLTQESREHVRECSECRTFKQLNTTIGQSASEWRNAEPNPFLKDRIGDVIGKTACYAKPRPRWQILAGLATTAAAAVLAVGVISGKAQGGHGVDPAGELLLGVSGGGVAQADFLEMKRQVAESKAAHVLVWTAEYKQPLKLSWQEWWRPGALRITASPENGGDRLFTETDGKVLYHAYRAPNGLITAAETEPQDDFKDLSRASLESLIRTHNQGIQDLEITSETSGAGQLQLVSYTKDAKVSFGSGQTQIVATSDKGYHRFIFTLDAKSHRPMRLDMQHDVDGKWMSYMRLDFDFTTAIPDSKFLDSDLVPKPAP